VLILINRPRWSKIKEVKINVEMKISSGRDFALPIRKALKTGNKPFPVSLKRNEM
jgi:hypothetical protein